VTLAKCGKVKLMKFFGLGLKSKNNKVFSHLRCALTKCEKDGVDK